MFPGQVPGWDLCKFHEAFVFLLPGLWPSSFRNRIKFIDLSTHYLFHQLYCGAGGQGPAPLPQPPVPPTALPQARIGWGRCQFPQAGQGGRQGPPAPPPPPCAPQGVPEAWGPAPPLPPGLVAVPRAVGSNIFI